MSISTRKNLNVMIDPKLKSLGDPDKNLTLKKEFLTVLNKRIKKKQKLTSHKAVLKKYGYHKVD